ncbi:Cytochrome P450 [Sphingobium faniae]|nr:Cytochrome P450 [Sphingobium faniae]
MVSAVTSSLSKPAHIPAECVVDLNIFDLPLTNVQDPQAAYAAFRKSGDILWTPHNDGHWILTRAEDIKAVQNDWKNFIRSPQVSIPPVERSTPAIPIQLDPPIHAPFRRPLTKMLLPKTVEEMAVKVRSVAISLIEAVMSRGECDFVKELAELFPILIFLDLVDLPHSDREYLLPLAEAQTRGGSAEDQMKAFQALGAYLAPIVAQRQANPGSDLFSAMVSVEVHGTVISFEDALNFCTTVIVAGLDTVASMMGFIMRHFALHREHRVDFVQNMGDDTFVRNVVEEMLRRYSVATSTRVVANDMEYKGLKFMKGDMILTSATYANTEDQRAIGTPFVG